MNELCPKCGVPKNMQVSTTAKKTKDKDGKEKTVLIHSYHCETCNSFVRSETIE